LRDDELAMTLGRAGADRVLVCEGVNLGAAPLDATHGSALFAAAERVPPIVVLFPAGGPGDELGPPLATRLGAAYAPGVDLEISDETGPLADGVGRITLRRWRADRSGYRQLDPVEMERPVVAILGAHGVPRADGTPDVDVEVIACVAAAEVSIVELSSEPDDLEAVTQARGLVLIGAGVAPEIGASIRAAAAARADVAVVDANTSPRALAAASPGFVLEIGRSEASVGISPRARVGLVDLEGAQAPTLPADSEHPARHDVVWPASGADAWRELIAALGGLR
jgi:electron transfer flavoprotein alpha subunit